MDKTTLYNKLDIDSAEEFKYYENLSALLEEDDYIEENLIKDLIREIDKTVLAEHMDSYFEEFLKHIPDDEGDLYITVDNIGRVLCGLISEDMSDEDINSLSSELVRFRKWYVHDLNVFDKLKGTELNVRDAIYDILAAGFLNEKFSYDFRTACDYDIEGYDVRVSEFVEGEFDESQYEGFSEIDLTEGENIID